MKRLKLHSPFQPTGDQPEAIAHLVEGLTHGVKEQVLLGVTGSGKTFTMANVVAALQRPTLVISHNKTLAAQLYQEFREFFPDNAVSYFVSYYDYYMPESYIPSTDTYIEKETEINEEIDRLRLATTTNLLTRPDSLVVASVSCIYNIGSPKEYGHFVLELRRGMQILRESILSRLVDLQYERNNFGFHRGTFRVRGDTIDLYPAYEDMALRMVTKFDKLVQLVKLDPLTGKTVEEMDATMIYPAKHYMTDSLRYKNVFEQIRNDLIARVAEFKRQGKLIEAQRIAQRVNYDLEMIAEMGYVNGIENYSRYIDGRRPGEAPYTLLNYFDEATRGQALSDQGLTPSANKSDWLLIIDESHMTMPQIRGMYTGDRSRKQTLIDYGFRLPAALDNRPLRFDEFLRRMPQTIYVSATPNEWEICRAQGSTSNLKSQISMTKSSVVEQLIRPTGLVDPKVTIKPSQGQIDDLMAEIEKRVAKKERVLVTTLTKRMAEDLARFLQERGIKVHYLHSDIVTLKRTDILADLRVGVYDVVVGINLLREGLDLPEVSLVAILDADKEGFLRSRVSLIQTMGRAARHVAGEVIMYADVVTKSMREAVAEVERRRLVQLDYNMKHGVTPQSIQKPIRKKLVQEEKTENVQIPLESMTPQDKKKYVKDLTRDMRRAGRDLDFESAAKLRDLLRVVSTG